jgi:hypothetical protein
MPREWNTPHREKWNEPISSILKAIDNHVNLFIHTGDNWHMKRAEMLRVYVSELKTWIHQEEEKERTRLKYKKEV